MAYTENNCANGEGQVRPNPDVSVAMTRNTRADKLFMHKQKRLDQVEAFFAASQAY
ncbi:hypothetical protein ACIKP7_03380 [Pseudomonas caricapapayae]|jgi:hypothetical protein|uniref:Uncharacterized protein n=1 Tax=Pseudomonas caricapapayae TaxID=46678 RepID=A0ACC7LQ28_9PSED